MNVTMVWPDCDFLNGEWGRRRVTSYWVHVAPHELPRVLARAADPEALADAMKQAANDDGGVFLLVSEDLDSIVAMSTYYPESGQWNGLSPFQPLEPWTIEDLNELVAGPKPTG